jgi:hypothetical protein
MVVVGVVTVEVVDVDVDDADVEAGLVIIGFFPGPAAEAITPTG